MNAIRRRADAIIAALRARRIRHRISQRRLGAALGAPQTSVWQWETRRRVPDARTVRLWHTVLGMRVPADVEVAFRPDIPRCRSRPAYERHRRRGEECSPCRLWFNEHRRLLRAEKRERGGL